MITIDANEFVTKHEMHAALRAALGEENYCGSNLDALHDKLTSICEPTTIVIKNWSFAARRLGEYADGLWHVLDDSADENPNIKVVIE
ncbi:MAG: barstar family protein [Clostridia bacterium]|nr:barstar family protein [Clostridia bacterium]